MKDFSNITHKTPKQLQHIREKLADVYSRLPKTKGCMENITAEGGCGAWCCQTQNPQVLEVEFANSWNWVNQTLSREEAIALIARALKNFLSNKVSKGCIFFDYDKKMCLQHTFRPYACRIYGIMPEEEWKPRYEQLKVLNNDAKPQCDLVSTESGEPFTKNLSDTFWKQIVNVEAASGVPHRRINDKQGGTYRTFHDHLIQSLYGSQPQVMRELAKMRLNATEEEKERFVRTVIGRLLQSGAPAKPKDEQAGPEQGAGPSEGAQDPVQPE